MPAAVFLKRRILMDKEKTNSEKKPLLKLFFTMLYISTFTFGGGFVIVTLMKKKFVDEYKWIDDDEMLDLTAIAQSSPGAIAVNAAILVGYKIGGLLGTAAFGRPLSIWQSGA